MLEKIRLYFITDSKFGKHEELAKKALEGGVRAIQFREKRMSGKELYEVAKRLRKITYDYDALLFINDRVDIAIAVDADGVHVGQSDLPYYAIREFFYGYIGVSAHNVDEAKKAERFADYLGVGPVFRTTTKEDAKEPIGVEGLKKIVDAVKIPVIAIGGINRENIKKVLSIGAFGVAVVSAIASQDAKKASQELLEIIKSI